MENLKKIILENQRVLENEAFERILHIEPIARKAVTIVGVRRCGKSTLARLRAKKLLHQTLQSYQIFWVNYFDDRLDVEDPKLHQKLLDAYFSLFPEVAQNNLPFLAVFDEIQETKNWERFIDRILRNENAEVWITGSSAQMLSSEVATQMRGRSLTFELFPCSFLEFLKFCKIEITSLAEISGSKRFLLQQKLDLYFEEGGFPETIGATKANRVRIHQDYFHGLMTRDVAARLKKADLRQIRALVSKLLIDNGSFYTINKLVGLLQAEGYKVSKQSVSKIVSLLESAFAFFSLPIFSNSVSIRNTNPKKIYCIDPAFVESVSAATHFSLGRKLENFIFLALRRLTEKIWYFKTESGKEIDFIWNDDDGARHAVQVCWDVSEKKTLDRELAPFLEIKKDKRFKTRTLVVYQTPQDDLNLSDCCELKSTLQFLLELDFYFVRKNDPASE